MAVKDDLWITVDDGDTFEGRIEHWQDVFFSNADRSTIQAFCDEQGWKVEFTKRERVDATPI